MHLTKNKTLLLFFVLLIYLLTRLTYLDNFPSVRVDEVWYTQQAYTFIHEGKFATPFLGDWMNVDKIAYMIMPIFSLTSILFFKLLGFGYVAGRLVSVVYGLLTVIVVYFLGKEVRDENTGLLASFILAMDTLFFFVTRQIRPEAPVVFFSSLGALLYLMASTSEKNKGQKYFASGAALALGVFSHPMGVLVIAAIFIYSLARKSFFKKQTLALLAGIAVPSIFYVLYALVDIHTFLLQAEVNWVRVAPSIYQTPFIQRILEEPSRYIFYLFRYKSFTFFALAIAALLYSGKLKEEKVKFIKYMALVPLGLLFLVAGKSHWYFSSVLPYFAVLMAILVIDARKNLAPNVRLLVLLLFAAQMAYSVAGEAYITYQNKDFDYASVCDGLRPYIKDDAAIFGPPQLWFCFPDKKFYTIDVLEILPVAENTTSDAIISRFKPEYYISDEDFFRDYMSPGLKEKSNSLMKESQKIAEVKNSVYGTVTLYRGPYAA